MQYWAVPIARRFRRGDARIGKSYLMPAHIEWIGRCPHARKIGSATLALANLLKNSFRFSAVVFFLLFQLLHCCNDFFLSTLAFVSFFMLFCLRCHSRVFFQFFVVHFVSLLLIFGFSFQFFLTFLFFLSPFLF